MCVLYVYIIRGVRIYIEKNCLMSYEWAKCDDGYMVYDDMHNCVILDIDSKVQMFYILNNKKQHIIFSIIMARATKRSDI